MILDGQGKGRVVPTRKLEPSYDVSYEISHVPCETAAPGDHPAGQQKAVVHSIVCDPPQDLPLGDFDLLVDDRILRLKHKAGDPEWLVLSSNA